MAIALVQAGTSVSASTATNTTLNLTTTLGTAPSSSNVLIALISVTDFGGSTTPPPPITPPSGWTFYGMQGNAGPTNGDIILGYFYWRTGTTSTSFNWSYAPVGSGASIFGEIIEVSGTSTTYPIATANNSLGTISGTPTTVVSQSLTALSANLFPLSVLAFDASGTSQTTPGAPASFSTSWSQMGDSSQTTFRSEQTTASGPLTTLSQSVSVTYTYASGKLKAGTDYLWYLLFLQPPFTAIAKVQTGSGTSTASTSLVLTYGSTPTSGNKLIAFVAQGANAIASTGPTGWTLAKSEYSTDALELWWKDAGGSEPSTYTWTLSTSVAVGDATGYEYSGVLTGASGINGSAATTGTSAVLNTGSVTPTVFRTQPIAAFSGIVTSWSNLFNGQGSGQFSTATWTIGTTATSTSYSCQEVYQASPTGDTATAISASNKGTSSTRKLSIIALLAPSTGTANVVTATDSFSAITDSLTRSVSFTRTTSDSMSSFTDALSRLISLPRIFSDSFSAITDSVATNVSLSRTASDTTSAWAETLSKVQSFTRTLSDSPAVWSDSLARVVSLPRAISDTTAVFTDVLSRYVNLPRASSDTLVGWSG